MKYIRTSEKIYDTNDLYISEKITEKPYCVKGNGLCIYKHSIVKEADTIEELCDQFVFVDDFYLHEHRVCHSFENAIALSKKHNVDIKTFRGAIWTDKGLIYVAKMNEEGELELL